jgi:hypothetical protein
MRSNHKMSHVLWILAACVACSPASFAASGQSAPASTPQSTPVQSAPSPTPAQTTPGTTSDPAPAPQAGQGNAGQNPSAGAPSQPAPAQTAPADNGSNEKTKSKKDKKDKKAEEKIPDVPAMPNVKAGSIDDVNAVGSRDIGGRGMGNWYSTESEIKMGKGYAAELEKSTKFITDPVVTEYVNRIGQNIVKNSDCKVPFTIKVIDSDEVNAMALPGGFFYVNSGLILAADEEAEMAGVMAHETAHVCAHHAAREQTRMNYAQLGSIPLIMMTGYSWTGYGIYEAVNIAIPLTFLQFSRDFEAQADYLGVQYMYRAGYDPQAFVAFFEKIQDLEKHKPGAVARAFSTHPQTPDRIEHSQEEIARILPPRDEYVVTTSEFDDVKSRLARIENKRKLLDNKDNRKPTLRRASTSTQDPSSTSPDSSGDDRPTLHRRDN